MNYHTKRKLAYVLMAVSSSHIWYYLLVDGLCDTAFASLGFSLAHLLAFTLPFLCCLVWNKDRSYNRATFVMTYFFVMGTCDYLHGLVYNIIWDISEIVELPLSIMTIKSILIIVMIIVRVVLSLILLKWSFRHVMIAIKFKDD